MTNATRSRQRDRRSKAEVERERRAKQRRVWIVVAALVVAAVIGAILLSGGDDGSVPPSSAPADAVSIDRASGPELAPGDEVPGFSAPGLDGGTVSWTDSRGTPTVLVVWASWCPHCQAELPVLVPAVQARDGVGLVSVTTAIGENPGPTPEEFLADEGLTLTTAVDDADLTLMRGLGVSSFPTVYYVGADGAVVAVSVGESSADTIDANLDAIVTD